MKSQTFFLKQAIKGAYKIPLFEIARQAPRLSDFIPIRPIRAGINVTNNCNSRCITCYHWKKQSHNELTLTELTDILHQMRSLGIADLHLLGGEPLLRNDLSEIILNARNLKFDRITVTTNGLLLTREKVEQLIENGLTSINISLNGEEKIHDFTRGIKGAYARTLDSIRTVVELRNSRFHDLVITVQTIVMDLTLDQIVGMADMCHQFGIGISFSPLNTTRPWQANISSDLFLIDQEKLSNIIKELHHIKRNHAALIRESHTSLEYIKGYYADIIRKDIPCYLGYLVIAIGPSGEVFPGGCLSLPAIGNLRQVPLKQMIHSRAYRESIKRIFLKECTGCACDYALNLYTHLPSIIEEIKWRLCLK